MLISSLMDLQTPHAVVDGARMRANIARVASYARDHRIHLRPHIKTHKDPQIAQIQLESGACGLTVATAREAEVMASVCNNILVAFPPVDQGRIDRLLSLKNIRLTIALDSVEAVKRLQARWVETRSKDSDPIHVLVEVDLGARRTGVSSHEDLLQIARAAQAHPGTEFEGIMLHPGHVRRNSQDPGCIDLGLQPPDPAEKQVLALREELLVVLKVLADAGIPCNTVSGGNTPTLFLSHLVPELTEIRPGTYIYCDRDTAAQGNFSWADCAYSVLATVVSTAVKGQAVVDAGIKALAKEPLAELEGYGALLDRPDVIVRRLSEEHGILDLSQTAWSPRVGDRVRIVPNHACVSVHLQDYVAFVETGDMTVNPVAARGR
jgi:D-serine deaminase-like pyridoxal phosphate-dependent protein